MQPSTEPKKKFNLKPWQTRLLGALSFLVTFVLVSLFFRVVLPNLRGDDKPQTVASTQQYTAPDQSFTIAFPGDTTPQVKSQNQTVQGIALQTTSYSAEVGNGFWQVGRTTYPAEFDMSDIDARLNGSIDGAVSNVQGATLVKREFATIDGQRAIFGVMNVKNGNQSITGHVASTLRGNTLYVFVAGNATESDFRAFTGSFKLK